MLPSTTSIYMDFQSQDSTAPRPSCQSQRTLYVTREEWSFERPRVPVETRELDRGRDHLLNGFFVGLRFCFSKMRRCATGRGNCSKESIQIKMESLADPSCRPETGSGGTQQSPGNPRQAIMPRCVSQCWYASTLSLPFFLMLEASKLQKSNADPEASLRKLGVSLSTSELDGILRIFDSDGSGSIDPCTIELETSWNLKWPTIDIHRYWNGSYIFGETLKHGHIRFGNSMDSSGRCGQ